MKRKIEKYLASKEKSAYDHVDRILEMYATGELKKLLSPYDGVGIYPLLNKRAKTIQINYSYHNIFVTIDFDEENYSLVVYPSGISAEEIEKLFEDFEYQDDFDFIKLIEEIDSKLKSHPKLKDTTLIKKEKKIYSLIAWISFCLPFVIFGIIGLYCLITGNSVKLNAWWIIFGGVIPFIMWFVFDIKSARMK